MLIRTRRQGNSVILTVLKKITIPTGIEVEAKLVKNLSKQNKLSSHFRTIESATLENKPIMTRVELIKEIGL